MTTEQYGAIIMKQLPFTHIGFNLIWSHVLQFLLVSPLSTVICDQKFCQKKAARQLYAANSYQIFALWKKSVSSD